MPTECPVHGKNCPRKRPQTNYEKDQEVTLGNGQTATVVAHPVEGFEKSTGKPYTLLKVLVHGKSTPTWVTTDDLKAPTHIQYEAMSLSTIERTMAWHEAGTQRVVHSLDAAPSVAALMEQDWDELRRSRRAELLHKNLKEGLAYKLDGVLYTISYRVHVKLDLKNDGSKDLHINAPDPAYPGEPTPNPRIWRTANGGHIPIREMTDDHLKNAIKYLESSDVTNSKYAALVGEAYKRGILGSLTATFKQ